MRLTSIAGNSQRLDAGAMFGNAPKELWSRWVTADASNRMKLACRALLVEEVGRKVLLETGVGNFLSPDERERYGIAEENAVLLDNLNACGVAADDIDVVVLSHLHFDHAGGLLSGYEEGADPTLVFANASYVVGRRAWQRACKPHLRDRRSFIDALQPLLEASGRLELVDGDTSATLGDAYRFHYSEGHTPGLMMTEVRTPAGPVVYASDLIPGTHWVHLPITMGYDRYPELLVEEKERLYADLLPRDGWICFTHDPDIAMARIERDQRGRYRAIDELSEARSWGS